MPVEHVDIVDGERHEPKGASTALTGQSYVSDGAQSGNWSYPIHYMTVKQGNINDDAWFVSPVAGTLEVIRSVIGAAVATSDVVMTTNINGTPVTGGILTITQAASAAGDTDVATPSAANTVAVGDYIHLSNAGGATGGANTSITIGIRGV